MLIFDLNMNGLMDMLLYSLFRMENNFVASCLLPR